MKDIYEKLLLFLTFDYLNAFSCTALGRKAITLTVEIVL